MPCPTYRPISLKLQREINRSARIYLDESTTSAIESYIENTRFSFESDGIGLINTYADNFFTNLLDQSRSSQLAEVTRMQCVVFAKRLRQCLTVQGRCAIKPRIAPDLETLCLKNMTTKS